MPALLTARQLASELGVSPATIARRVADGTLPFRRLGARSLRFDLAECLAATDERRARVSRLPARKGITEFRTEAARRLFGDQGGAAQSQTKKRARSTAN